MGMMNEFGDDVPTLKAVKRLFLDSALVVSLGALTIALVFMAY